MLDVEILCLSFSLPRLPIFLPAVKLIVPKILDVWKEIRESKNDLIDLIDEGISGSTASLDFVFL